jgi:hypothetical protein
MKHDLAITLVLIGIFVLSQIIGLLLINKSASVTTSENGTIEVNYTETAIGPRPETTGGASFLYLAIGILIGTVLVLILIKYNKVNIWKFWFFIAVAISVAIALGVLINK